MFRKAYLKHKTPDTYNLLMRRWRLRNIWCHYDDGEKESGCVSSMRTNKNYITF